MEHGARAHHINVPAGADPGVEIGGISAHRASAERGPITGV